ncbi:aldehyde dehydrogenase family 16 member A1-like [Haemaphysalis longicornis]
MAATFKPAVYPKVQTVKEVFERPCYGDVMDTYTNCSRWIHAESFELRGFVDGQMDMENKRSGDMVSVKSPADQHHVAKALPTVPEDFRNALKSSQAAQAAWAGLEPQARCLHLYNMVRSLQKHQTSFAEMESMQSGKTLPQATEETQQMVRYLYHCAGQAMTLAERFPASRPKGVVLVYVEDASATCPVSAWRVGEVLATGNAILILAKSPFCLVPLHLAEIASSGGLPNGLINVLVAPTKGTEDLLRAEGIAHVHVVAKRERCRELRRALADTLVPFSGYWGVGRPLAVVLEGADLHGAAASIAQCFALSNGKGESCGVQVFVQECVYAKFLPLLRKEVHRLRIGQANDRTQDMTVVFSHDLEEQPPLRKMPYTELPDAELLDVGGQEDQPPYPPQPAMFADVAPSSPVVTNNVGLPLVLVTQFRTAKESVSLVNSAVHHCEVSLWTERTAAALELAAAYKATTVFVNSQGLRDASVEFGSPSGIVGGERGLATFIKPAEGPAPIQRSSSDLKLEAFGTKTETLTLGPSGISPASEGGDTCTYKLFYGGQQKRPLSGVSNASNSIDRRKIGYVPEAGRKDVREAVQAALAGFKTWSSRSAHSRAQVLYYLAENLSMRSAEMAHLIRNTNNRSEYACKAEVGACIRRLFYWAAACDKDAGSVRSTTIKGTVVRLNEPLGVIGVVCSDRQCLLSNFVSAMAAALAAGNAVVVLPCPERPQAALRFCQILETSDVPAGVVNVLSAGDRPILIRALAEHHEVASVWYHGQWADHAAFLEYAGAHSDKLSWTFPMNDSNDQDRHWMGWQVAQHVTRPKSLWMPAGDTFAN